MLSHKSPLSQLCSELLLEVCDELGHHGVDLLVVEGLGLVLQNEVDGVALLALGQVLAFVHVEELHVLQELLLCLLCNVGDGLKLYALVDEQGEVAAHGRIFAYLVEQHLFAAHGFGHGVPMDVGIEHVGGDVGLLEQLLAHDAHFCHYLSAAVLDGYAFAEDVVVAMFRHDGAGHDAEACKDVLYMGLELVERRLLVGVCP